MIYFDLDGVLRDIHATVGWKPRFWEEMIYGQHIVSFFNDRPHMLRDAPPTVYYSTIMEAFPKHIAIMTACPSGWRKATFEWIDRHMKQTTMDLLITDHLQKLHLLKDNDILIEDCPRYTDYSKVILIDRSYNRDLELPHVRVSSPDELMNEITRRQNERC